MTNRTLIEIMEEMKGELCNKVALSGKLIELQEIRFKEGYSKNFFDTAHQVNQQLSGHNWTIADVKTGKIFLLEGEIFFYGYPPLGKWILKDDWPANIINMDTNDEIIYSINVNTTNIDVSCRFMLNMLHNEKGPYCSKKEIEDMLYQNFHLMYKN